MFDSKISTYKHMMDVRPYSCTLRGIRGCGTDTRVLVLLNDSNLVCLNYWVLDDTCPHDRGYIIVYTCVVPVSARCANAHLLLFGGDLVPENTAFILNLVPLSENYY
jgi:hypothetical protein